MDPLNLANGFATIVGLIGMFRAERRVAGEVQQGEFLDWLRDHGFPDVVAMLQEQNDWSHTVTELLAREHGELTAAIEHLNRLAVQIALQTATLRPLAEYVEPTQRLPEQAVAILRTLNDRHATRFQQVEDGLGQYTLMVMDGGYGEIETADQRFIRDDLQVLRGTGCLQYANERGNHVYSITRLGAAIGGV